MSSKVIDFDAWKKEQAQEPVVLKIGGQEYNLPADLPADVALEIIEMRATHAEDENVPPEVMERLGKALFSEEVWQDIIKVHRVGVSGVGFLVQEAMRVYNEQMPSPNRATRRARQSGKARRSRSLRTGPGSKRTSKGSTS